MHVTGKNRTNKHKHLGSDRVRNKPDPSLGQLEPSLGQNGHSLQNYTGNCPVCFVCSWDGRRGVRLWDKCSSLGQMSREGRAKNKSVRSEMLQNERAPNFRIFGSNFAPNLLRSFPKVFQEFSCFSSEADTTQNSPKSPPFLNTKSPATSVKVQKRFLESGQSSEKRLMCLNT